MSIPKICYALFMGGAAWSSPNISIVVTGDEWMEAMLMQIDVLIVQTAASTQHICRDLSQY